MAVYDVNGTALSHVYDVNATDLDYAYDIDGVQVFAKTEPFVPTLTLLHSVPMSTLASGSITPQGFAIYGDYYFQFFTGDNTMRVFNRNTYALVGSYSATDISHANTMCFAQTPESTGFPLLYISEWGESGDVDSKIIDVLRVSITGYTKVSSFTLPTSCGNHPSFIADWDSGKAYTVGYSGGTRDSEYMIISEFNLSNMATPTEQYQVPYMGVLNGWEIHDGKLIYYGNAWDDTSVLFSFIDIATHEVTQFSFAKTGNEEYEDCCVSGDTLILSNWLNDGTLKYQIYSMNLTGE